VTGHLEGDALYDQKAKQGNAPFGVEMIITNDDGARLPWDGKAVGRLKVRGPCVASGYYRQEEPILDEDGFFDTGDIAAIEPDGTMRITDRSKDVIKSGGEWISSIEIENLAMAHPDVAEAAVIGVPHAKWTERPLLIVVPVRDRARDPEGLLRFFEGRIAKWWIPSDVQYVEEIPHTAAGKISKLRLREIFHDYRLPDDEV
jgi:fatty-acyl-CoA synthase